MKHRFFIKHADGRRGYFLDHDATLRLLRHFTKCRGAVSRNRWILTIPGCLRAEFVPWAYEHLAGSLSPSIERQLNAVI